MWQEWLIHVRKRYGIIAFLGWCLSFPGCIDEVQVSLPQSEIVNQLVVDGQINDGPGPYFVHLERTAFLGVGDTAFQPVTGAKVQVELGTGSIHPFQDLGGGTYILPEGELQGQVGESYSLQIETHNASYRSAPEIMPAPVKMEAIRWEQIEKEFFTEQNITVSRPFVEIYIDTPVPTREKGPYFRWQTFETYSLTENPPPPPGSLSFTCFYTFPINLQEVLLLNGAEFVDTRWENQRVADREIDWTFASKHMFSVTQISMTAEAYDYWARVQQVIQQVGSIFDSPPAAVGGNIVNMNNPQEVVLGYFEAVAIDTMRTFTEKADFDSRLARPRCVNLGVFDGRQPPECNNCRLLEGATLERPYFF